MSKSTNVDNKHSPEVISPNNALKLIDSSAEDEILQGVKRKYFHATAGTYYYDNTEYIACPIDCGLICSYFGKLPF